MVLLLLAAAPAALAAAASLSAQASASLGGGESTTTTSPSTSSTSPSAGPAPAAVGDEADLSITKVDSADPVAVGSTFTYMVNVTNNGPDRATGLVVTDTLPAGVTYVSASGGCTRSGATVTCTRNNLNSGSTASFVITVTASTAGNWTNVASVSATETDDTPANNEASQTTSIRTAAPTDLVCFADEAGVHLDWSDVPQATGYNVYRRTGSSGPFVLVASSATSSYVDSTAAVGQSYQYRVTALSAGGESEPSAHCTIASVPEFPTLLAGAVAIAGSVGAFVALRRRG